MLAAVLVGTGACATQDEDALRADEPTPDTTVPPPRASSDGMELLWSVEDVRFVSFPQRAWGRAGEEIVVTMGVSDGDLLLLAYSAETGEELWRRATTGSWLPPGINLDPVVDGNVVFHVVDGVGGHSVEAFDARSGDVVWTSRQSAEGFGDYLRYCEHMDLNLCITTVDGQLWELDVDDGQVTEVGPEDVELASFGRPRAQGAEGRYLAAGLYELEDGDVARVDEGVVIWRRSPSELFGGSDVTLDNGWTFIPVDDLVLAHIGPAMDLADDGDIPFPADQVAGIDWETGETRWLGAGDLLCGPLYDLLGDGYEYPPWIRCAATGTVRVEDEWPAEWGVETSRIDGFDAVTGKATWSVDMGAASALWDPLASLVRLDATTFALRRDDGTLLVVDVSDGSSPEVDDDDVGWCFIENEYDDQELVRTGANFTNPCSLDGERQNVPVKADNGVGVTVDGVFVWMDELGLHGAR